MVGVAALHGSGCGPQLTNKRAAAMSAVYGRPGRCTVAALKGARAHCGHAPAHRFATQHCSSRVPRASKTDTLHLVLLKLR